MGTVNDLTPEERASLELAAWSNITTQIPRFVDDHGQGWTLYVICDYCAEILTTAKSLHNHADTIAVYCPNCGEVYLSETHVHYWADNY